MPRGLPSREDLTAFIAANGGDVGKREISRAFGLDGSDRIVLKAMLRELAEEGLIGRKRKKLHVAGGLPAVVMSEVVERDEDGELIAQPIDWDTEAHGEAPHILIKLARRGRVAGPAPAIGDRVLLKTDEIPEADGRVRHTGHVLKIIEKSRALTLGVFRRDAQGGGRLIPVDKRNMGRELAIPPDFAGDAEDGDLVSVEIMRHHAYGLPTAKVKERLGSVSTEKAISLIAIHAHGIPSVFRRDALAEAEEARPARMAGREDWRDLPLVTIDPPDAKDHDDAVHATPDLDPDNEGGFILTVAIADVAAYVRPGSALDREALSRGNSVYFPDRVVPMLPERISNDLCSLRPLEDRPAMAVRMVVGANGRKRRHSFHRVMMRSAAKLSYVQAQAAIDGRPDETTQPLLTGVLRPLWDAYAAVKQARDARSPLELDLPERKILLKPDGTVDRVVVPERLDAHKLIEEFMILANVAAAETLEEKHVPLVYRVHDQPSLEKMSGLREFLQTLDIKLPKTETVRPAQFNEILSRVVGSELAPLVNQVILRSQAQAEYAFENYGHFGLHLRRYAHFTSPIRRYADLIVHRALIRALGLGRDGLPETMTPEQLAEIAARISASERRAMSAERETVDRLIAHHMAQQMGAEFKGRIAGVTRVGLFVTLDDTGADGFIPASTLGQDYYRYDEARHALIGDQSGEMHRLGDRVEVKLIEAAPVAGALRFELISEGTRVAGAGKGPRGAGKARFRRPEERPRRAGMRGKRK
ncbi:ribonuclease R [Ancylobacter pratisalsi]|uniref:Ribonuclease R n=1 Tax=Ancylobacter pratisalsi TaxID=1745854 RepID=A0A6P1YS87_9HYPH|nr:ribonuclease R [Ancylobacter pratisalsi]